MGPELRVGEPPWPLSNHEKANIETVGEYVRDVALWYVTATQLNKSIADATLPIRTLLRTTGFHDYEAQRQGPEAKEVRSCLVIFDDRLLKTTVSMYRPKTKKGDPRIWIAGGRSHLRMGDVLALFVFDGALCVMNMTASQLHRGLAPAALRLLEQVGRSGGEVAMQLLARLHELASAGLHKAEGYGDTAVGRTLEKLLGLKPNSKKTPDYFGIELKSHRVLKGGGRPRSNLFAQVPDWDISPFKSSEEILRRFGYNRRGTLRLNCTLEIDKPNSQFLFLRLQSPEGRLEERVSANDASGLVAAWRLATLHQRLQEKHAETFWVEAESVKAGESEFFRFTAVVHTRAPSTAMFDAQLGAGNITVDHLMKIARSEKSGIERAHERGPLFKVKRPALKLLFPAAPVEYRLG